MRRICGYRAALNALFAPKTCKRNFTWKSLTLDASIATGVNTALQGYSISLVNLTEHSRKSVYTKTTYRTINSNLNAKQYIQINSLNLTFKLYHRHDLGLHLVNLRCRIYKLKKQLISLIQTHFILCEAIEIHDYKKCSIANQ